MKYWLRLTLSCSPRRQKLFREYDPLVKSLDISDLKYCCTCASIARLMFELITPPKPIHGVKTKLRLADFACTHL